MQQINVFRQLVDELLASIGRSLSDEQIAHAIGVQPKHVWRLSHLPDDDVRPVYLLALMHCIIFGYQASLDVDDPSKPPCSHTAGV